MSRRPTFLSNLVAIWANHAACLLVGLFLMPYVLHTLGDSRYGVWLFVTSVAGYSGLLNLGFGETISRYVSTHYARREWNRLNQVVNGVLGVYCGMGLVALLVAAGLAWWAPWLSDWANTPLPEIRLVFMVLGVNIVVSIVGSVFGGVLHGTQRFDLVAGGSLFSCVLRPILTVSCLASDWGLLTLALIQLALTVTENLVFVACAFAQIPTLSIGFRHFRWQTLRDCFSFSSYVLLNGIADRLIHGTDTIVIGLVYGAKAIVPYHIALRLCEFISRPVEQIAVLTMPRAGELHANADTVRLQRLVVSGLGSGFLLMTGFFIGAACFGQIVIETWVGAEYADSYLLLLVLLGARSVVTPLKVVRSALLGIGHARPPAVLYFVEAVANLGLTLLLIRPFGLMGVALGTAIPVMAVELGILLPYAMRRFRLSLSQLIREVVAPALVPLALLGVYSYMILASVPLQPSWFTLLSVALGGGTVLGISWLGTMRLGKSLRLASTNLLPRTSSNESSEADFKVGGISN